MIRETEKKDLSIIANEWNNICEDRDLLIENKKDYSLTGVNIPCIMKHIEHCDNRRVLDVGCGTGFLTNLLSETCSNITGIDISTKSIEIAKRKFAKDNLNFKVSSIEEYSTTECFSTCIANMVLMVIPDLESSLKSIYNLLNPNGTFLITITHPCFWPIYWQYNYEPWFNYKKEIFIEQNFKTSLSSPLKITTHIHRPLEKYFFSLINVGFKIIEVVEPSPILPLPEGYKYDYPRFLFLQCQK